MSSLKELLGELFTEEMEKKLGNNSVYVWDKDKKETEPIPKFRVNEMIESSKTKAENLEGQIKTFEETIAQRDKDLKDLKKAAEGNNDLVKQIEDLQKANKEQKENFDKEKENLVNKERDLKKVLAIKEHLLNAGVNDPVARDTLALKIQHEQGLDKIEFDEKNNIKGFPDVLKPIQENKAFAGFFGKEVIAGQEHKEGGNPSEEYFTREQLNTMTPEFAEKNIDKVNKSMAKLSH